MFISDMLDMDITREVAVLRKRQKQKSRKLEKSKLLEKKMAINSDLVKRGLTPIKEFWLTKDISRESDEFLTSMAWRAIRYQALKIHGRKCLCCGATPETGAVMHVDHIKPRMRYPELALDINNLQVLCHECNHGKGNWDESDFRKIKD